MRTFSLSWEHFIYASKTGGTLPFPHGKERKYLGGIKKDKMGGKNGELVEAPVLKKILWSHTYGGGHKESLKFLKK